jgi:hypothetical protein
MAEPALHGRRPWADCVKVETWRKPSIIAMRPRRNFGET